MVEFPGGFGTNPVTEAFGQNYPQNIHEKHSVTTEASDSGIRIHGVTSYFYEMEDIAGKYDLFFDVTNISQLSRLGNGR